MKPPAEPIPSGGHRVRGAAWARWAAVAVAAVLVAFLARRLPIPEAMQWIRAQGALGPLLFVLLYVVACVALVPGSLLTLGAGAVFGPLPGFAWVTLGANAGACASFLLGRSVAREAVARRVGRDPRLAAVDAAVAREGWKAVALLRLSPVLPFNLLNYALGLTRVGLRDYLIGSFFGMMPATLLYTWLGAALGEGLLRGETPRAARSPAEWALYGLGLLATVAVTVLLTRTARRALAQRIG